MRLAAILVALILPPLVVAQDATKSEESRTVRVTAEGLSREEALKQALRKALEQGAGAQIASFSQTSNYELIRDTIYSRAAGVVSDYRVVSEEKGAGDTVKLTVEATVRADAVARTWGEVQNVLDQIGRPRIMVWIDETIDGEAQRDSVVASRIEEMFTKIGFDLVAREAVQEIARREKRDAEARNDAARIAALGKDAKAHIVIRGSANANRAGLRDLHGIKAAFYNCDVQARVYHTDTGRLLASESLPQTAAGVRSSREFSPQAARSALVRATFPEGEPSPGVATPLAQRLYESVMEQWATQITAGGDIDLEVSGVDFKTYLNVKKALAELSVVKSADGEFTSGVAKFRIKATTAAETLAEKLTAKPFSDWLEVVDLKTNRIQCRASAPEKP